VFPLAVAATIGQMSGKIVVFYAGRGAVSIASEKVKARVSAIREKLEKRPWAAKATLLSSAIFGLPPLYIMSIACGTIGMGLVSFLVIGFAGRLIHFTVVALLPQYARLLIG
jgi:membrane protein YqaA with SNARE-associated domain